MRRAPSVWPPSLASDRSRLRSRGGERRRERTLPMATRLANQPVFFVCGASSRARALSELVSLFEAVWFYRACARLTRLTGGSLGRMRSRYPTVTFGDHR